MSNLTPEDLFRKLYTAKDETAVEKIIEIYSDVFRSENWKPLGSIENNFGVVENQQSSPVAALVEKLTNSIDAILMRRCYEEKIDPKSPLAPRSVEEAVKYFFPQHKNWDLTDVRNRQAEHIQIIGHSEPGRNSDISIVIYDDGEGQHPEDFESTFLSLLRGNKNEIHFVQGKYNMGGSGAIVFCGRNRYQLIASKRFDNSGNFGFTIIRKHPLTSHENITKKNTWYEYLAVDGKIPSFSITELDLGLYKRNFLTGTVIKLYSYDTKGNQPLRREMSRSLNEFLYEPALPFYIADDPERYSNERNLRDVVFGLKRRLMENEYIEMTFSEAIQDGLMGEVKVTVHVFKARAKGKNSKKTKKIIQDEYFKNNMAVLFSVNGQVHGHYTSEFITRTLKFNLLRDYLLIHVDCTNMKIDFRSELFMASRDRLKQGEESKYLRKKLGDDLSKGELRDVYRRRKDNISVEHVEQDSVLKNFAENLPINPDLRNLLSRTFKLDSTDQQKASKKREPSQPKPTPKKSDFNPQRFPSFFQFGPGKNGTHEAIKIPLNGSRTVQFDSDVESQYFDRVEDPGDMQIAIMNHLSNDKTGGDAPGTVNDISDVLTVNRKSPSEGKIKVVLKPTEDVQVGDEIQVKVDLHSPAAPDGTFQHIFWVKVTDPLPDKPEKVSMPEEEEKLGLPNYVLAFQSASEDQPEVKTWEALQDNGIEMDYETVMYPDLSGDVLETIYINMDSAVYKNHLSGYRNLTVEQEQLARNKYISSVYFHTLFLYVINKKRGYIIAQEQENGNEPKDVDMGEYLRDVFTSYYAAFLLNFGTSELMEGLG